MATERAFIASLLESLEPLEVIARPMFGEYAAYVDGKVVALICDNTVFVKLTPGGLDFAGRIGQGPPYPGARPHLKISKTRLKDADWLARLLTITSHELPEPRPRKSRSSR